MPIHKHEPVSEESMLRVSPRCTICEVIRWIYLDAKKINDNAIMLNCRIAIAMAKAMDQKLKNYKSDWVKGFYDSNPRK